MVLTQGLLTYCYGDNYLKFAKALIKSCEKLGYRITVVTDNQVLESSYYVNVVYKEKDSANVFEPEKYSFDLSPYDLTLKVDVDSLVLSKVNSYFEAARDFNLVSGYPRYYADSFKSRLLRDSPYRKVESSLNLPEIYSAALCFDKSEVSKKFFERVKYLFENWYSYNLPKELPPTTDSVMSIAWFLERRYTNVKHLEFCHFKKNVSYFEEKKLWWSNGLYLNGHKLEGLFHYYEKDFLESNKEILACMDI